MCVCDPMKRTPYCGNIGCEWPGKEKFGPKIESHTYQGETTTIPGGQKIQYPYDSVFRINTDIIFDTKDLDGKVVTLRVATDSGYTSIYAVCEGEMYFLSQTKGVPGRENPNV